MCFHARDEVDVADGGREGKTRGVVTRRSKAGGEGGEATSSWFLA